MLFKVFHHNHSNHSLNELHMGILWANFETKVTFRGEKISLGLEVFNKLLLLLEDVLEFS